MNTKRYTAGIALSIAAMLTLSGCTANTPDKPAPKPTASPSATVKPTPTPSASPTEAPVAQPTPAPAPEPTKPEVVNVVIGADSVRIENKAGNVTREFNYTDTPNDAIATLTDLYGVAPEVTYSGEEHCNYQNNYYKWDGLQLTFHTPTQDPSQAEDWMIVNTKVSPKTDTFNLTGPRGIKIGDPLGQVTELVKDIDNPYGTPSEYDGDTYAYLLIEQSKVNPAGIPEEASGAIAYFTNDAVTNINAPAYVYGDC
jgi:hypothetical protein